MYRRAARDEQAIGIPDREIAAKKMQYIKALEKSRAFLCFTDSVCGIDDSPGQRRVKDGSANPCPASQTTYESICPKARLQRTA